MATFCIVGAKAAHSAAAAECRQVSSYLCESLSFSCCYGSDSDGSSTAKAEGRKEKQANQIGGAGETRELMKWIQGSLVVKVNHTHTEHWQMGTIVPSYCCSMILWKVNSFFFFLPVVTISGH